MQKNSPTLNIRPHAPVKSLSPAKNDYALEVLWICLSLEVVFILGLLLKKTSMNGGIFYFLTLLAPALIIILASSWKRALKLSFLLTLLMPLFTALLIFLVAIVGALKNPESGHFINRVIMSLRIGATLWFVLMISATLPSLFFGAIAKWLWDLVRQKK